MRRTSIRPRLIAATLLAATLGGCYGSEEFQRGYLVDPRAIEQTKPGMSADQVLQTLGTPSTVSTVGNQSWYYISQKTARRVQFLGESVVDQQVTAVYFNKGLKVERVALYGIQDGQIFDFVSRSTPSGGTDKGFIGALFRGVASLNPFQ